MSTDEPRTRAGDDPEAAERITRARDEGRKRTIFMSVVASGLVSLFIGYAIEVQSSNSQVQRSRDNCHSINNVVKVGLIAPLVRQSDQTLGNPKKGIKPFKLDGTSFEDFKPLIIAQATRARKDAADVTKLLSNCEKSFPKRSPILFFGN